MDGTDKGNRSTDTAHTWTGQGSNPGLRGERPVTDRLSHDRPQTHPPFFFLIGAIPMCLYQLVKIKISQNTSNLLSICKLGY